MSDGLSQFRRTLLVNQAALFTFDGDRQEFIRTGRMGKHKPIPMTPEVAQKIAKVYADGGRLIID